MRKIFSQAILSVLLALLATTPAGATEFWVDGLHGNDANDGLTVATAKKTIQGGLSLATSAGDVVNVLPAEYNSPFFVMADGVTVRGIGEVVVTAGDSDTNNHSDVVIQDLSFRNNNAGLRFSGATTSGNLVENCRFSQCTKGVRGVSGAIFKVRNCLFAHCERGISMEGTASNVLEKNTFFGNETGVFIHANTVVRDSAFVQNTLGVNSIEDFPLQVHFSNFFGNTTDVDNGTTIVDGNFDDPLFIDAASDVFFVKAGSPLLDQGEFDMRIGAFGQGFHTSNDVTKDEPAQAGTVWGGWIDFNGDALTASSLVELNDQDEVILKDGVASAAIYSPVFDTGSAFTVISSVDFAAFEDTFPAPGSRKIIDAVQNTPRREVRIRTHKAAEGTFSQDPSVTPPSFSAVDKHVKLERRAQFVQMELVLRSDGD